MAADTSANARGSQRGSQRDHKGPCRKEQGASDLGALGGTRTPNLLIRSQMLYPLSYERSPCSILHSMPSRCVPKPPAAANRIFRMHARHASPSQSKPTADLASVRGYSAWIQLTRSSRLTVSTRAG